MKKHLEKIKMNLIISAFLIFIIIACMGAALGLWCFSIFVFGYFHNSWDPTNVAENCTIGGIIFAVIYCVAALIRRGVERSENKNQTKQSSSIQS